MKQPKFKSKLLPDEIKKAIYDIVDRIEISNDKHEVMFYLASYLKSYPMRISKQVAFFFKRNKKIIERQKLTNLEIKQKVESGELK
jgi:hypothetical protein